MKKLLLLVVCACGGDDDPPASDTPAATLTVTMPSTVAPGDPLVVGWEARDAADGDAVRLRVLAPGAPLVPTRAGYHFTGSAPATVYRGAIAADGALSPTDVLLPATGQVTLGTDATAGDWTVYAELVRGGTVVAIAGATSWVATSGVHLDLSRTWAGSGDVVRATVRTKGPAEPMRLSAWLTTPDGTIASLPGIVGDYAPVAEGTVPDVATLLAEPLGALGAGRYLVTARLETLAGIELGSAGATVQVCDEPGTIRGALPGAASVSAIALDDRRIATGDVGADGAFELAVPAGRWAVVGAETVEVGCGQVAQVAAAASRRARPGVRHGPTSDEPAMRFLIQDAPPVAPVDADDLDLVDDLVATEMRRLGIGGVLTADELVAQAGFARMQMLVGTETNVIDVDKLLSADFVVRLEIKHRSSGGFDLYLLLIDAHEAVAVPGSGVVMHAESIEATLDVVPAAVAKMVGDPADLRKRVDFVEDPLVRPQWSTSTGTPGQMLEGGIRLSDPKTGKVFPGVTIQTRITPGPGGAPISSTSTTDANGIAPVAYPIPAANPPQFVHLEGIVMRKGGVTVTSGDAVATIRPVASAMLMQKPVLRTNGDRTTVAIEVPSAAMRVGTATSDGIALDGPAEVRFDAMGRARFDVVTDARSGPAEVRVALAPMSPFAHEADLAVSTHGYVVKALDLNAFVEPRSSTVTDQLLQLRGIVTLDGVPLPSTPVAIELIGAGEIAPSAMTDGSGALGVFYRAPPSGSGSTTIKLTVVKDADIVERTVVVTYEPPCSDCPVGIETTTTFVDRGGKLFATANQPVTWSATRGSITSDGLWTAPDLGGVAHITATSVANPNNKKSISVVEACKYDEVVMDLDTWRGDVTPTFAWSDRVSASCLKVRYRLRDAGQQVGVFPDDHAQDCAGGVGLPTAVTFAQPQLATCSVSFAESGPCGQLARTVLALDPDTDGFVKRRYDAFMAHQPLDGGACIPDYGATGILSKQ